jgi:uncharacterized protein (TIGR02391 family)
MTVEATGQAVCSDICRRFLQEGKSTSRRYLVRQFRNTSILANLEQQGFIDRIGDRLVSTAEYIPRLSAFVLADDESFLGAVKRGTVSVLGALLDLFLMAETGNPEFTSEEIFAKVRQKYADIDESCLAVGLLMACRQGAVGGYQEAEHLRVTRVFVDDHIVDIHDPTMWFDNHIHRYKTHLANDRTIPRCDFPPMDLAHYEDSPDLPNALSGSGDRFDWSLLHGDVQKIARSRFDSGHFADAVEASLKAINERLQLVYRAARGEDRDGATLMNEVFSLHAPLLRLGDLKTNTGQDMQKGFMQIFAGTMTGIRNPKAHGNVDIDQKRAIHFLFLASLLMYKIDEAEVVKPADSVAGKASGQR